MFIALHVIKGLRGLQERNRSWIVSRNVDFPLLQTAPKDIGHRAIKM